MFKYNPFDENGNFRKLCTLCTKKPVIGTGRGLLCRTCYRQAHSGKLKDTKEVMNKLIRLRIRNFIDGKLPPDIYKYDAGQECDDMCPMCRKKHEWYRNFADNLNVVNELFRDNLDIEDIRNMQYYFYMCKSCALIYDDYKEDDLRGESDMSSKLFDYINKAILNPSTSWRVRGGIAEIQCYFCRYDLTEKMSRALIIPVGIGDPGGIVYGCEKCFDASHQDFTLHHEYVCICKDCGSDYPITEGEYESRVKFNTLSDYICPYCFLDMYHEREPIRFIPTGCKDCGESIVVDRCQHKRRIGAINEEGDDYFEARCEDCTILVSYTFSVTKGSPTEYWMAVHFIGTHSQKPISWVYMIFKCTQLGKIAKSTEVMKESGYPTPFDASEAGTYILNTVYNPLGLE